MSAERFTFNLHKWQPGITTLIPPQLKNPTVRKTAFIKRAFLELETLKQTDVAAPHHRQCVWFSFYFPQTCVETNATYSHFCVLFTVERDFILLQLKSSQDQKMSTPSQSLSFSPSPSPRRPPHHIRMIHFDHPDYSTKTSAIQTFVLVVVAFAILARLIVEAYVMWWAPPDDDDAPPAPEVELAELAPPAVAEAEAHPLIGGS